MNRDTLTSLLYEPFVSKKLTLSNRVVMAPMTRMMSPNEIPDDQVADYYARRAEENVGLIITEGTLIDDPASPAIKGIPFFHGDALNGWKKVVEKVHAVGGKIVPQIWHMGATREGLGEQGFEMLPFNAPTFTPSGLNLAGDPISEVPTEERIEQVINAFAKGAADAKRLGFDGVQLHGAHGHLIDQFLWEKTNRRTDDYGGTMLKRTKFATEIVKACRREVGEDFPIMFRFSQWKEGFYDAKLAENPDELAKFLEVLMDAGVDIFDCSTRRFWEPEFEGSDKTLARWTKEITNLPVIAVGSVGLAREFIAEELFTTTAKHRPVSNMLERLQQGDFDLIAVGRALISDYAWSTKIKEGRHGELQDFNPEALMKLY